ncbi:hypothetical protein TSOC_014650, partial [Tetrabaena socialis]
NVQVNVVLVWLTELADCHTADGRPLEAASALRRALTHMASSRGEQAASASALNEQLIEALAAGGRPAEAAEAAEAALAARRGMFGEGALVVATSALRAAQRQQQQQQQLQPPSGPGPALRALQHAEAAARISAAAVEECSKRGMLSGPPPDKLVKRLRAAHTLGAAAKLVATLAGVPDSTAPAATATTPPPATTASGAPTTTAPSSAPQAGSWWPFGRAASAGRNGEPPSAGAAPGAADAVHVDVVAAPVSEAEPVAELQLADRRLEQAAAALTEAAGAGQELL